MKTRTGMIDLPPPMVRCSRPKKSPLIIGGAFALLNDQNVPLSFSIASAEEKGMIICLPHFYAAAIEYGWSESKTSGCIHAALKRLDRVRHFPMIAKGITQLWVLSAQACGETAGVRDIARHMREMMENPK